MISLRGSFGDMRRLAHEDYNNREESNRVIEHVQGDWGHQIVGLLVHVREYDADHEQWNGGERFQMDGRKERSAHYDSIPRLKPVSKSFIEVPSKHDFFCYRGYNNRGQENEGQQP